MFICLNGDIERQFEFVQQNWINNSVFSGLGCEQDGLVGAPGDPPGCFTIQSPTVRQRTLNIPSFVRVRGGAYFFLRPRRLRYLATLNGGGTERLPASAFVRPTSLRPSSVATVTSAPRVDRPRGSAAASAAGVGRTIPAADGGRHVLWPIAADAEPTSSAATFLSGGGASPW